MGKAARWLKSLLGMKKEKETPTPGKETERKEKRRWSFTQPRNGNETVVPVPRHRRNSVNVPATAPTAAAGDAAWLRSYLTEAENEERGEKHAIAVAAATAVAADAAVAAAQAAMAVVRLTTHGRGGSGRERWAAFKIQAVFRGFLARKALRALKGLVKLQAHVRGYLVRKRATATLRGMQALVRAQAAARLHRRSIGHDVLVKLPLEAQPRMSLERYDESRSEVFHSKRMSATHDPCYDDNPKIVEIDTYKPRSRPYLRPNYYETSQYGGDQDSHPIPHLQYSTNSGPIPGPVLTPARLSVPSRYEWGPYENNEHQFRHRRTTTAHSTPRFANMNWGNGPFTPAKSVCGGDCEGPFVPYRPHHRLGGNYHPNYMASTQSFEAKSRSQSAPRQRPSHPSPSKKRLMPLEKLMESRHSLSGVRMHRSFSEDREAPEF